MSERDMGGDEMVGARFEDLRREIATKLCQESHRKGLHTCDEAADLLVDRLHASEEAREREVAERKRICTNLNEYIDKIEDKLEKAEREREALREALVYLRDRQELRGRPGDESSVYCDLCWGAAPSRCGEPIGPINHKPDCRWPLVSALAGAGAPQGGEEKGQP